MTERTSRVTRAHFSIAVLAVLAGLLAASCGTEAQGITTSEVAFEESFRVVGEEQVGLNGVENEDRAPISFMLLGSADPDGGATEEELVQLYADKFASEGWEMEPHDVADNWWTYQGVARPEGVVALSRVGPASRFHDLATIEEGYSRTKFRELAEENPEPLIVVSVDPGA